MPGTPRTITRRELAEYVEETFEKLGLVERDTLVNVLHYKGASQDVIDLVAERVPEGVRMTEMRALWDYLGDVPIDRVQP